MIGAVAAALHGGFPATAVLAAAGAVVAVVAAVAEPLAAPVLGLMGWFTAAGFSRPPYAQLRLADPAGLHAAVVMGACAVAGVAAGVLMRGLASSFRLWIVDVRGKGWPAPGFPAGIRGRRQVAGVLLVAACRCSPSPWWPCART